jgi:hypothetical protein
MALTHTWTALPYLYRTRAVNNLASGRLFLTIGGKYSKERIGTDEATA